MTSQHRVRAVNTAADSENKIHDDRVAAEFGFRGGLVPGVTVYGYMTLPVIEHFGEEWMEHGAMSVRFKEPVYESEEVVIDSSVDGDRIAISLAGGRAQGEAWLAPITVLADYEERPLPEPDHRPPASHETLPQGAVLGTIQRNLNLDESRMSAPLPPSIGPERFAHPAILLALANELLVRNVVLGPWIHVSSVVTNFAAIRDGDPIAVYGKVADAYERKGHEFAELDVLITAHGRPAQHVRHTAIWRPRPSKS
ncbi:MAG TPA: hypothetical protein VKU01_27450 [Bryobacteraceae bacterium]|nr:hypothetical protein [Bryobacteraceae bacterium]